MLVGYFYCGGFGIHLGRGFQWKIGFLNQGINRFCKGEEDEAVLITNLGAYLGCPDEILIFII